jgi:hypothetical protein
MSTENEEASSVAEKAEDELPVTVEPLKEKGDVVPSPPKVEFTEDSDISNPDRRIWVVTTASLPWRTGTAVNPLMRALSLTRGRPKHYVTLLLPWLDDAKARKALYGSETFEDGGKAAQEEWIRNFCRTRAKSPDEEANLRIQWWDGVYHHNFGSIFPSVDICTLIPKEEADVAILEEPEHLNWFRVPKSTTALDQGDVDVLGWAQKFRYVVGILHTNYDSYVKKYGMGTSLITSPALNALSSMVIKAYCHRVIRLSGTLTSLVPRKEVTANVHGVMGEFLDLPVRQGAEGEDDDKNSSIYYVGKLIWAKGFEDVLEVQELFRTATGNYFEMDIYGGGNDDKAIKRAFFGRHGQYKRDTSDAASDGSSDTSRDDKAAAKIFGQDESLRSIIRDSEVHASQSNEAGDQDSEGQEVCSKVESTATPFDVLNDLSKRTVGTGAEAAGAALQLVEAAMQTGFGAFSKNESGEVDKEDAFMSWRQGALRLGPRRSTFKWRKFPIPARFLGVKDHIAVRAMPKQYIFLNMSTSEVLCTTSAEALAMCKFVVLPKHPSNEFFLQFPNCLAYESLDDCVVKLQYAVANKPIPLSDEQVYMLSWEGATERLYQASGVPKVVETDEARFVRAGLLEEDIKAARFHVETARRSQFVSSLFNGKILSGMGSP